MIKLIAIDLDGTLLNSNHEITSYTEKVLKKAKEAGIHIVLCTGRPLASIQGYLKQLSLFDESDYSITFNGGYVQHNVSGNVIASAMLHYSDIIKITKLLEQNHFEYDVVSNGTLYVPKGQSHTFYEQLNHHLPVIATEKWDKTLNYNKVVVPAEPDILEKAIPIIQEALGTDYYLVRSLPRLFEIANLEVGKEKGLKHLCEYLDISMSQVVAFGDEANDIGMLQEVGYGIAMGNATTEVKSVSRYITLTNDEDGVAKAIEALIFEGGNK